MLEPGPACACGAALPAGALSCSMCHRLVHGAELERLAAEARDSERAGNVAAAAGLWRRALELLPHESKQAEAIRAHVQEIEAQVPGNGGHEAAEERRRSWTKAFGPLGVLLVFLWKFKAIAFVLLGKAKFLLLGITKAKTLFSMVAFLGVYWNWFGWRFALGFVLGIYVHEMGHVWALRRFGLRASSPMFIPGVGAFVSLYDSPVNAGQDARIGLAGPMYGLGAAFAALGSGLVTGGQIWMAIAHSLALINLFNLIPIWQLDGGRGFRALGRSERLQIFALTLLLWFLTGEGMFFLVSAGIAYRVFWTKDHAQPGDRGVFLQFAALLAIYSVFCLLPAEAPR